MFAAYMPRAPFSVIPEGAQRPEGSRSYYPDVILSEAKDRVALRNNDGPRIAQAVVSLFHHGATRWL